ncbi:hypothetical protein L1887_29502 [Cichorium endivia]|nr:hypothetical protein L1887_29502 [Cichorium endivia]
MQVREATSISNLPNSFKALDGERVNGVDQEENFLRQSTPCTKLSCLFDNIWHLQIDDGEKRRRRVRETLSQFRERKKGSRDGGEGFGRDVDKKTVFRTMAFEDYSKSWVDLLKNYEKKNNGEE